MENFQGFKLSDSFGRNGFEVFDGILDGSYCSKLAHKLGSSMDRACITVDNDGVHINTKNGGCLVLELPEIKLIHDFIYSCMASSIEKLLVIDDLPVAISANLLKHEVGHTFRYHFDRNEYTAVLYLTENEEFPLRLYPNIRTDPLLGDSVWLYQQEAATPINIAPTPGRLVVFRGRTCLHGVIRDSTDLPATERISLQFAYDTRFLSFETQAYYGRDEPKEIADTVIG
jgi:hypothetical protein